MDLARNVDFRRIGQRLAALRFKRRLARDHNCLSLTQGWIFLKGKAISASLRQHYLDQVLRVCPNPFKTLSAFAPQSPAPVGSPVTIETLVCKPERVKRAE